ncbi:MAG: hypothetical protein HY077_17960 [Elusimicrobia bacterium]|nr:hypothetical protein [Elusimicrobiota bacterium]
MNPTVALASLALLITSSGLSLSEAAPAEPKALPAKHSLMVSLLEREGAKLDFEEMDEGLRRDLFRVTGINRRKTQELQHRLAGFQARGERVYEAVDSHPLGLLASKERCRRTPYPSAAVELAEQNGFSSPSRCGLSMYDVAADSMELVFGLDTDDEKAKASFEDRHRAQVWRLAVACEKALDSGAAQVTELADDGLVVTCRKKNLALELAWYTASSYQLYAPELGRSDRTP